TKLGPDVSVLSGPGLAAPSPAAVQAGVVAGRQTQAALANPPGRFSDIGHILRVVVALVFLLVVPGLIAARWFQLEGPHSRIALLANRAFGFLVGAVFLAVLGDGIVQAALAKTIAFGGKAGFSLEEARSPRHILVLVLLTYLPYTFISPFMGVVIDRFDRRKLLVVANGFRAAVIVVMGLGATSLPDAVLIGALVLTLASTRLILAIWSASMPR